MRTIAIAALALVAAPSLALAAATAAPAGPGAAPPVSDLSADAALEGPVQVTISQQTLAAGESLPEHRQPFVRQLFVVKGKLKVSNLVTGEEQLAGPGEMAVEAAGDWHVAQAMGDEPAEIFVIDQQPAGSDAVSAGGL
jgi:quercetin dioxygenase-like cupin family protein